MEANTETQSQVPRAPAPSSGIPDELSAALGSPNPQARLRAALAIGTGAQERHLDALVDRCRSEPDFFVRDMLTWALTRLPADATVPRLVAELRSDVAQARSQALHTLSKIGDRRGWEATDPAIIGTGLIADPDTEVARSAWRAAVALVPGDRRGRLARALVTQFGRGDLDTRKSLSRALVTIGDEAVSVVDESLRAEEEPVRTHAMATREMIDDPDAGFAHALSEAKRVVALGSEQQARIGQGKG
ncbi:HEAT repeat protein [Brevibacterium sanguinis]|uniref:HEAT repeat protein n=2 Tax=Brevibacterium TaxID=1696 RepID=A0A366ILH2_9MICO|nr:MULTISPECIES: HEAT repeat domain-containing protein [Brevibacterium]RBP67041.1 HEAT repeat protein [Brevibacterium sanguinis]RBP73566.1 HEAT repeat protein [Brevibacterium celere]